MDAARLKGAMSAIITPFDSDGRLDEPALRRLVEAQIERGIDGLVACGTTGETPTLDSAEQERVIKAVVETAAGRIPVLAGTGTNDTRATAAYTKTVASWGVDAALVVCPYYNKPTQEGLYRHFKAVSEASSLPVVAYNVPGRTVSDLMPETVGRLVEAKAIVAIKDATASMARATRTLNALPEGANFALLSGDDFTILPFVACGGQGVISVVSNICPSATSRLVRLAAQGQLEEARPIHNRLVALTEALFCGPNPVPLKSALARAGWCTHTTRLPLEPANESVQKTVFDALTTYVGAQENIEGFMG